MIHIDSIDHFVLTVHDIDATIDFYTHVLGMRLETFAQGRKALHFGQYKINLHEAGHEFKPHAKHALPGSADLCFVTTTPPDDVLKHLKRHKIRIEQGVVQRTGALGRIESIYVRDPDGNLIEISSYPTGESNDG